MVEPRRSPPRPVSRPTRPRRRRACSAQAPRRGWPPSDCRRAWSPPPGVCAPWAAGRRRSARRERALCGPVLVTSSRGAGVAAVAALTGAALLGLSAQSHWQAPGWPRFLTAGLHRNIALVGFALVAIHVLAVVANGYVNISLGDAVMPFTGSYKTWWVGVGALSFDLLLLVLITSALRRRLGYARWRRIHLASYACLRAGHGARARPRHRRWPHVDAHARGALRARCCGRGGPPLRRRPRGRDDD